MKAAAKASSPSSAAVPNNLPNYLTSFVGRKDELAALKALIARSRMVTLVGPGGAGKSRLAVALGAAHSDLWPEGLWWVELAPVNDLDQVAGAVVAALGLPGRGPAQDVAISWLAARRTLLVLDNCEHLVKGCAEFCQAALERCSNLTILATSREALGLPGEARWPVSSLQVRDAVDLFEARGALVRPTYIVAAPNLDPVTEICERVDRLPLAIELAAARVGMMTEHDILSQLSDRIPLLTGGNRTAPKRQQTLLDTLDWSYRLLTDEEKVLFRRLSVFRGGFTLESAQAVCADHTATAVLDSLSGLVQKSMVVAELGSGLDARYRLLESHLAYGQDRLREAPEFDFTHQRYVEHFLNSLSTKLGPLALPPRAPGAAEAAWIAIERSNLWAAADWARTHGHDLGLLLAVRLAQARFADVNAMRRLLEDTLDHAWEKGVLRNTALILAASLAGRQGDNDAALRMTEAAVVLARERRDVEALAFALLRAGNVHHFQRNLDTAAKIYEDAIAYLNGSSNRRLVTVIRNNLALLAAEKGDYAAAHKILVGCLATARTEGDIERVANYLDSLARAQLGLDDHRAAAVSWKESLSIYRRLLDNSGTILCLEGLSSVASASGDDKRALRLAAAANRLADEWSHRSPPWMFGQAEESRRRSRSRIGKRGSEQAEREGFAMSVDRAVDYALSDDELQVAIDTGPLSPREREVVKLVAAGMTNRQIGDRLFIAERSAEGHVERIRNKLGVRSRTEVATWAFERGIVADQAAAEMASNKRIAKRKVTHHRDRSMSQN